MRVAPMSPQQTQRIFDMHKVFVLLLGIQACVVACTTSEPLPEPSLSFHRTSGDITQRLTYYWSDDSLLVLSASEAARRLDVGPALRSDALTLFTDSRLAIYKEDLLVSSAPVPNCPGTNSESQIICKALELASTTIYVQVIHPESAFLDPESFLFDAPVSMQIETAEMIVFLSDLMDAATADASE